MFFPKSLLTLVLSVAAVISAAPTESPKNLTARAGNEIIYLSRCEGNGQIGYEAKYYPDYTTTLNGPTNPQDAAPYRYWNPYQLGDQYMTFVNSGTMMTVHLNTIDPGWYNMAGSAWYYRHWDCRMDNGRKISQISSISCYTMYYCQ